MLKSKKTLSMLLATVILCLTCSVGFSANAQDEQSDVDALTNYLIDNNDVVEFYSDVNNYTQDNAANNAKTRNFRVYVTDDYDMYMKVVVLYQLYYAAAFEIMEQSDYMYSPSINSSDSSDFSAWTTYTLTDVMYDVFEERGLDISLANSICLGSHGSSYNPTRNTNATSNAATTAVSYTGSIITTTDTQGYTAYRESNSQDYGMAYSLNFNMHLYQKEIDGVTYNIRYFAQDDVTLTPLLSQDDMNSLTTVNATTSSLIIEAIEAAAFSKIIAYPVTGGNIYIDTQDGYGVVVDIDDSVTAAEIPAQVNGIAVVSIDENVFYYNSSLTSIVLPETITSIAANSFRNCSALKTVVILAQNVQIKENAFRNCAKLETIVISGDVTTIAQYAFAYCYNLKYLAITGSVESIGYKAFALCTSLEVITLTSDLGEVNADAFVSCTDLQTIYFAGTQEQWLALDLGFDEEVEVVFNHVCQDSDEDGYCDVCTPNIEQESEQEEETSMSFFETLIAKIQEYIEILLSVFKYNFKLSI